MTGASVAAGSSRIARPLWGSLWRAAATLLLGLCPLALSAAVFCRGGSLCRLLPLSSSWAMHARRNTFFPFVVASLAPGLASSLTNYHYAALFLPVLMALLLREVQPPPRTSLRLTPAAFPLILRRIHLSSLSVFPRLAGFGSSRMSSPPGAEACESPLTPFPPPSLVIASPPSNREINLPPPASKPLSLLTFE